MMEALNATALLAVIILIVAAASGCGNDHLDECTNCNDNPPAPTITRVSSVGNIAALTSETAGAEDDFAPRAHDAVYDVPFTGGVAIVTGSEDLEVNGPSNLEIWEVPADRVTEFETLIRTYLTYQGWVPDLFPTSYGGADDLRAMLATFACGIELPEFAPYACPAEYIPDTLFRRVATGYHFWRNAGAVKVLFLIRR